MRADRLQHNGSSRTVCLVGLANRVIYVISGGWHTEIGLPLAEREVPWPFSSLSFRAPDTLSSAAAEHSLKLAQKSGADARFPPRSATQDSRREWLLPAPLQSLPRASRRVSVRRKRTFGDAADGSVLSRSGLMTRT